MEPGVHVEAGCRELDPEMSCQILVLSPIRCAVPQTAAPPAEELLPCQGLWVGLPRLRIPGRPAGIPAVPEPEAAAAGSDGPRLQASTHRFVTGCGKSCPLIGQPADF